MSFSFFRCFRSEWMKKKGSLASWIVVVGAFFTPAIVTIARILRPEKLSELTASDDFWTKLWMNSWESMAVFLLPIGVILATSLITQIEYKNNTWKQLHTLPVRLTVIFFAKLAVILVMMLQFFALFNVGIYLSGVVPALVSAGVSTPRVPFPMMLFLKEDALYFIDCLPIVALQYLISLRFKNFLVPVGAGFLLWIGALGALRWSYGYWIPYTYCMFNYLKSGVETKAVLPTVDIHAFAAGYFVCLTAASYLLYLTKEEKG